MKFILAVFFFLLLEIGFCYETTSLPDEYSCDYPNITNGLWVAANYDQFSEGAYIGDRIRIFCKTGYRFHFDDDNDTYMECLEDGSWVDTKQYDNKVVCERIGSCPVPVINNGLVPLKEGGYLNGDAAPVECNHGYELRPPEYTHILCQRYGSWYPGKLGMPTCWAKACPLNPHGLADGYMVATINGMDIDLVNWKNQVPSGAVVQFFCSRRFNLSFDEPTTCLNGFWTVPFPQCKPLTHSSNCLAPTNNPYSTCLPDIGEEPVDGEYRYHTGIRCKCNPGYVDKNSGQSDIWEYRQCMGYDYWSGKVLQCIPMARGCHRPPQIEHGDYTYIKADYSNKGGLIPNDTSIRYTCDDGYQIATQYYGGTQNSPIQTCMGSVWSGNLPLCEKRTFCDRPLDIQFGNYHYGEDVDIPNGIGSSIIYTCDPGYKAVNGREETILTCLESGYWSEYPPKCLPVDSYCQEPAALANGAYTCSPTNCNLFKQGTTIEFYCKNDYILKPDYNNQPYECQSNGQWSFGDEELYCDKAPDPAADSKSNGQYKTIVVVVGTSLSVFALLTIVLILFLFHKHYKRPVRRCRGRPMQNFCTPPEPPAYSEMPPEGGLENAVVSDADSTALISFPDGTQATLPSYDEVVRGKYPVRLHRVSGSSSSRPGRSGNEFRALPVISQQMRQSVNGARERELSPDHRDGVSIGSFQRADGLSVTFGSIETMNVSDNTSTTVTLGTYDSGASNPSLSQRAATGSLGSDHCLTSDDAPLLDPQHDTLSHRSQTASPSIPEEDEETHA